MLKLTFSYTLFLFLNTTEPVMIAAALTPCCMNGFGSVVEPPTITGGVSNPAAVNAAPPNITSGPTIGSLVL